MHTNSNGTMAHIGFACLRNGIIIGIDDFIQSLAAQGEAVSVSSAVSRLNTLLTKGLLKKRKARMNGRMLNLYAKA